MSMRVPDEFIALLRDKVDITDVISEYVKLKRVGQSFVGLCPFHGEKSPSFHVTPAKGFYYCFGCGAGGTVFNFLMEMEHISFVMAVEELAKRAGVPMPVMDQDALTDHAQSQKANVYRAIELAARFYNHILMNHEAGASGLSYVLDRGVKKPTIVSFMLGYAPTGGAKRDTLIHFLHKRDITNEVMKEAGLVLVTDRNEMIDRFRGRVMYPIWDMAGRVVGFGARALRDEKPKYLNSPDTSLFHKGHMLYGYHKAKAMMKKTGRVILLEGYMDAIALHQAGITNAVATLGTALTPDQALLFKRTVDEVILLYDGDAAGRAAALKNMSIIEDAGLSIRVAELPGGLDPDEYIAEKGPEVFQVEILAKAKSALFYRLHALMHSHPYHKTTDKVGYLQDAIAIVAKEESSIERETALRFLRDEYDVSINSLADDLERHRAVLHKGGRASGKNNRQSLSNRQEAVTSFSSQSLPKKQDVATQNLLTYMLMHADVARQVQERLPDNFSLPIQSALQAYLYAFYAEHDVADPALFLSFVDDPAVVSYATSLLQKAINQGIGNELPDPQVFDDYLSCIMEEKKERQLAEISTAMKEAQLRGDLVMMREKEAEFRRLLKSR
nr:DNA primase [Bacilli bacterium]